MGQSVCQVILKLFEKIVVNRKRRLKKLLLVSSTCQATIIVKFLGGTTQYIYPHPDKKLYLLNVLVFVEVFGVCLKERKKKDLCLIGGEKIEKKKKICVDFFKVKFEFIKLVCNYLYVNLSCQIIKNKINCGSVLESIDFLKSSIL